MEPTPPDLGKKLEGWEEIRTHLRVARETARTYEKTLGLPVHREISGGKSYAYAYEKELDAWTAMRQIHPVPLETEPPPIEPSSTSITTPSVKLSPNRRWLLAATITVSFILCLFVYLIYDALDRGRNHDFLQSMQAGPMNITSDPGSEEHPSFSPDATQVAFTRKKGGLFIKAVDGRSDARQLSGGAVLSANWSPDGRWIAFVRWAAVNRWDVIIISPQGGEPRTVTQIAGVEIAWSLDSKFLAVVDRKSPNDPFHVDRVTLATGERMQITTPESRSYGDLAVQFSPDGKHLAFARYTAMGNGDVYLTDATGGNARRLVEVGNWIGGLAWTLDSREIVFGTCFKTGCGLFRAEASAASSKPVYIGAAGTDTVQPAIGRTKEGTQLLAFEAGQPRLMIFSSIRDNPDSDPIQLLRSTKGEEAPSLSFDGKQLAVFSHRTGRNDYWIAGSDGTNPRQITFGIGGTLVQPAAWSPDGSSISFATNVNGLSAVFTVTLDGASPRRLTNDSSEEGQPAYSIDGKSIYFSSNGTGSKGIHKIPKDGLGPAKLIVKGTRAVESSDGKTLYFTRTEDTGRLWAVPVTGGNATEVAGSPEVRINEWAVTQEGIFFISKENGRESIRLLHPETGAVEFVRSIPRRGFHGVLTATKDGRLFVWSTIEKEVDILMLDNFR